jgi:putative DNA methylase
MDTPRLIEHAFPLKQASLDSVHEKNVRHGHISTLHIWPARRPLAASRAALIATLLPDPGTPEKRKELCEKIGGKVVKKIEKKRMPNGEIVEREKEVTEGGILHWGRETENKEDLEWFKQEIRKAYAGRPPKVLDPFAGGGAIPLEAMRLGCEVTAVDINPVAWFILKCTLEYPQKLAGQTYKLPDFILHNEDFMNAFYKAHPHLAGRTKQTKEQKKQFAEDLFLRDKPDSERAPKADLAWHVRAWGQWVLDQARRELARFYPTYADFEPLDLKNPKPYEKQPTQLVPLKEHGAPDIDALNADFSQEYLADKRNPRWIAKPTVAYLWARTVTCKNCRATIPLLKTRWLCKKDKKRVLLTMEPNAQGTGVMFGIENNVPLKGGNTAQRREHDKRIGAGTMSRSGAKCPCCPAIMTMEDIRLEGQSGRLGETMTATIVDSPGGKEYRSPQRREIDASSVSAESLSKAYEGICYGELSEILEPASTRSISCHLYGIDSFRKMYTPRQQLALGVFLQSARNCTHFLKTHFGEQVWEEAVNSYLSVALNRLADYSNALCSWHVTGEKMRNAFGRFALPMVWDYCELNPGTELSGGYAGAIEWIMMAIDHFIAAEQGSPGCSVLQMSSTDMASQLSGDFDVIVTDPPYYEAISYADMSDFFYIWLRRSVESPIFHAAATPKTLEIVQHVRADKNRADEKAKYEKLMARAFHQCNEVLSNDGKFVIVFAHKHPDAWETLVAAIIHAGFVVESSWPIQTEMANRTRGISSAALASSVWLVCKKRIGPLRPGWDSQILEEMRDNIGQRLREFWDAGIRGPDFVWAATGPALEAYSKHPVVKKANDPGQLMKVSEFLTQVRRMVVDFVVGRVLTRNGEVDDNLAMAERLDEPTAYYLLHRNDFQMDDAPAGACILYAISCGVSDRELADTWDLISFTKGKSVDDGEDEEADADAETDPDAEEESGSKVKLKTWAQRKSRSLGSEAPGGKSIPLIDRVHCLMHLWKAGELSKVDEYLDSNGLRRQELFKRLLQSLIELSPHASEERSLLESISNHVQAKGAVDDRQRRLALQ